MNKNHYAALMIFAALTIHAQKSVVAAGGDASGKSGTVAFSVGEVAYSSVSGSQGSVSQGIQQAYEIYRIAEPGSESAVEITMHPNPTADEIYISIGESDKTGLSYHLYDLSGKLLSTGKLTGQTTSVNMKDHADGTYIIKLHEADRPIQTFKIIKNQ